MNDIMRARYPAVEGRFYGTDRSSITGLFELVENTLGDVSYEGIGNEMLGAVLPHAGHMYSAYQTIPVLKHLRAAGDIPETWIIIHPIHSGGGPSVVLDDHNAWKNCMGTVSLDTALASELPIEADSLPHSLEHSCEVIIPYIQYYYPDCQYSILPVGMVDQSFGIARELGAQLFQAVKNTGRKAMVIASSDFSHFLTPEEGFRQDQYVLEQIENKNPAGIAQEVEDRDISICGYGPVMALMSYCYKHDPGYTSAVIARGHSGEVSPSREVVDYISMLFCKSK